MAQKRFVKLSELKKGDVVRSPQFVEGIPKKGWRRKPAEVRKDDTRRPRDDRRGNTLFAVAVIEKRSYRSLLFFWKKFFVVELRPLKRDGGYDYDGQSVVVYPELDSQDFFVEVIGEMNFHWDGVKYAEAEQ